MKSTWNCVKGQNRLEEISTETSWMRGLQESRSYSFKKNLGEPLFKKKKNEKNESLFKKKKVALVAFFVPAPTHVALINKWKPVVF